MDKNLVKKIPTFKSGNFVFSRKYSLNEIIALLVEARISYKTLSDLPILPEWSSRLEEEIIHRSIFSTAALEGNPLKEDEVTKIIDETHKPGKLKQAELEIENLKALYDFVKTLEPSDSAFELTEELIKKVHTIITRKIDYTSNVPGSYRNHKVKVGDKDHGGVYTPPKCLPDIEKLMKEFIVWINSESLKAEDPYIRAGLAHYHLGIIHPFGNGNGRTARIIEAMLLRTAGIQYVPIMLSNYYYKNIDDYFWAFSLARKNKEKDATAFIKFVLQGAVNSLNEIKGEITYNIRRLAMRDYYDFLRKGKLLTQRQYDLLSMLLDSPKSFSLQDLFNVSPFNTLYRNITERTARRDLKKLLEMSLLQLEHNKKYVLDINTLG